MKDIKEIIYLVGQISVAASESFEWRKRVREYFVNRSDFQVIDPCLDEFNTKLRESNISERLMIYQKKGVGLIVPRDRNYVAKSTVAIANLNLYDEEKPLIGTMFELAWYHEDQSKAVIGIYDGNPKDDIMCSHPFVQSAIDTWTKDEMEACELVEYYFKKK